MVREWRRYQEPDQYARKGEEVVIVNMLLMARDQSVLLQKAPRQKGSAEPRSVDRSPYVLRPLVVKYSDHIYYSYFFLNYYILKSLFCFRSRVFNFLEHKEVSDRKTSLSLRESNFFMTPGCLSKNPAPMPMWKNMASGQFIQLLLANFYLIWIQVYIGGEKKL